jgi:hypothetical protein
VDIRVDIKGLDVLQKQIEGLRQSAILSVFNEWIDRITMSAKQLCNDPDGKRIKLIKTEQGKSSYSLSDKEAVDCVIKSIDNFNACYATKSFQRGQRMA